MSSRRARVAAGWFVAALAGLAISAPLSLAQVPRPAPPPAPRPTSPPGRNADSTKADTSKVRELIKWTELDSTASALLDRPGYSATRYQGVRVRFDAKARTLYLEGDPAAVGRGVMLLVGDTIIYNDSTKLVVARGDTLVLRDPTQNAADVVSRGELRYNIEAQRGSVTNISTVLSTGEQWIVKAPKAVFVADTTRGRQTAFYVRNGVITSCDDSLPDYHFKSKQIKMVSRTLMGGAAGGPVHRRRSRDVAAVHLPGHALGASQRDSHATLRVE